MKGYAKLGLMPVIISPVKDNDITMKTYTPYLLEHSNTTVKEDKRPNKFYRDVLFSEAKKDLLTEFIFIDTAYKYEHTKQTNNVIRSNIKLGENKDIDFWYIGIDLMGVLRADFNFDENTVALYSMTAYKINRSKVILLGIFVLFALTVALVATLCIRKFCQKKRQSDIREGEELMEL